MTQVMEKEPLVRRRITKAKMAKHGGLDIEFEQDKTIVKFIDGEEIQIKMQSNEATSIKSFPHEDLKNAFLYLRVHLAIIADQLDGLKCDLHFLEEAEQQDFIDKFTVNSFSIGGTGEHEGFTLSGFKKLSRGRVLNLNTPFTKFEDETEEPYEFALEAKHLIDHCCEEVELYMDGKIAPDAPDLFNSGATDDEKDEME